MLGLLRVRAGGGARFHFGPRALALGLALPAAMHFGGIRQAVPQGRGVGRFGHGQQPSDFQIEGVQGLPAVTVAHGGVPARVGRKLRAVDRRGDLPDLQRADDAQMRLKAWVRRGPFSWRSVQSVW